MTHSDETLHYRDAGVDIDRADALIERVKTIAKSTRRPGVLGGIGGFGALFELPLGRYKNPVLVSGTDGVGTKLRLAIDTGQHHSVGEDLVAMCVNDIVVTGAEPLYFLDYYATGKLDIEVAETVITGIATGCKKAGAALIGGETAELPGMYADDDYDLAGFSVGIVEKEAIIDGSQVGVSDTLIGLRSSGPHSNGYSLIRKVIEISNADLQGAFGNLTLGETLLEPTTIYVKPILALLQTHNIHALAHITGGGITENLPRVLPKGTCAEVDLSSWKPPAIFAWLQDNGNISSTEMLRTFNCGLGMVLSVPSAEASAICNAFNTFGIEAAAIGQIVRADSNAEPTVKYTGLAQHSP